MGLVFLIGFGGVGLLILLNADNTLDIIGGGLFLASGIFAFSLIFYLNISSMQYYYESALMKKYARYKILRVTDIIKEIDEEDEVIRCFISIDYNNDTLSDLFEISLEKEHLLDNLKIGMLIDVRIAEQLPSAMRIANRKLLKRLESLYSETKE